MKGRGKVDKDYVTAGLVLDGEWQAAKNAKLRGTTFSSRKKLPQEHAAGSTVQLWQDGKVQEQGNRNNSLHDLDLVTNMYGKTHLESPRTGGIKHKSEPRAPQQVATLHDASVKASRFSAPNRKQLQQSTKAWRDASGRYVVDNDGIRNEYGDLRSERAIGVEARQKHLESALNRIRDFAMNEYSVFLEASRRLDQSGELRISRWDFEEALQLMHLGLPPEQSTALFKRFVDPETQDMDPHEFTDSIGNDHFFAECRRQDTKQKRSRKLGIEHDKKHVPSQDMYTWDTGGKLQFIIFIFGFCCCPAWCLGWIWCNSKKPVSKRFGRLSAVFSVLGLTALVSILIYFVVVPGVKVDMEHCPQFSSVLLNFRLAGDSATFALMSSEDGQYSFKRSLHAIYLAYLNPSDKSLGVSEAILLDDIQSASASVESDGATLIVTCRVYATTPGEAQKFASLFTVWSETEFLLRIFAAEDQKFSYAGFGSVSSNEGGLYQFPIKTPTVALQSGKRLASFTLYRDNTHRDVSMPCLQTMPRPTGNVLDDWSYHNQTFRRTCWFTTLLVLPADPCLETSSLSCIDSGAITSAREPRRTIRISVQANSTEDLLEVYMRQKEAVEDKVEFEKTPMPTWFTDPTSVKLTAKRMTGRDACQDRDRIDSCRYEYTTDVIKGPYKGFFWVGLSANSNERHMYHSKFNPLS